MNNSMENMHTDVRVSRVDVRHEKMCPGSFLILGRSIIPFFSFLKRYIGKFLPLIPKCRSKNKTVSLF